MNKCPVIYIDEAGRGPLAGPVAVGGVIVLKSTPLLQDCADSKQLSQKKREYLYEQLIADNSLITSHAFSSAACIDRYGIITALRMAILRMVSKRQKDGVLCGAYRFVIDGNHDFGLRKKTGMEVETIIKGDHTVKAISAASILAKVSRDRWMIRQAKKFPLYEFDRHKGYGTKLHRNALDEYGLCEIHRKSFCSKYLSS